MKKAYRIGTGLYPGNFVRRLNVPITPPQTKNPRQNRGFIFTCLKNYFFFFLASPIGFTG